MGLEQWDNPRFLVPWPCGCEQACPWQRKSWTNASEGHGRPRRRSARQQTSALGASCSTGIFIPWARPMLGRRSWALPRDFALTRATTESWCATCTRTGCLLKSCQCTCLRSVTRPCGAAMQHLLRLLFRLLCGLRRARILCRELVRSHAQGALAIPNASRILLGEEHQLPRNKLQRWSDRHLPQHTICSARKSRRDGAARSRTTCRRCGSSQRSWKDKGRIFLV
mmetsp:Transcript_101941/g.287721  ORF Transcript_101941/g.287721 Transcript_101941/m.287721 type:complete len:225 (-) Transcript_101941:87-761(-)